MKIRLVHLLRLVVLACSIHAQSVFAAAYYVDSVAGHDSYSGTNPGSAWKTLIKVNSTTFSPGDQILFKAGGYWTGQLNPKGSGTAGNPIVIDMYDSGSNPLIDGNGAIGYGVLYFYNQEFWQVSNLELTNNAASGADRRGVYISAENYGTVNHIHLKNLHIHHIKGIVGQGLDAKRTGGIIVETIDDSAVDTRFNDIFIEGCLLETLDNQGIATTNAVTSADYPGTADWERRKITNLIIKNNVIHDIAKNAMIIRLTDESCLVEYNVCYDTAERTGTGNTIFSRSARGTVFQYNEGYLNKSTDYDGCLYDADLNSPQCIFQYSYSHDNNHGLFWQCTAQNDDNVIIRYNISQNDKGSIFCMNYANTSTYIYNNTVYIPEYLSPKIIDERRNADKTYYFYNNIIYNLSPTASYNWKNANRTISHNLFYGYHPDSEPNDPYKLTSDPMFVNPGTGQIGIDTVEGYKLQSGSPCIDSGMEIPNNGGRDYWGNAVPYNGVTDRGAHEYPDTDPPTPDPNFAEAPYATSCSSIAMTASTGTDPSGPVEYLFTEVSGNLGGSDSDWQRSAEYIDTGLFPDREYSYTVTMRDSQGNTTDACMPVSATTESDVGSIETLFSDGFELCYLNWESDSNGYCSSESWPEDPKSSKMNNTDYTLKYRSTEDYSDIVVHYARRSTLGSGEQWISEWYDGANWNAIEDITGSFDWIIKEFTLPAEAGDNPDFGMRFRVNAGGSVYGYVDVVAIEGIQLCCVGTADFDCSGQVDIIDFSTLANDWLSADIQTDITDPADGIVDLSDLSQFIQEWLQ